ncbi:P4hb, partial [Symbiodinium microadriaticum]
VAKGFKGKALVVNVPHTEDRVLEFFGITKASLPAIVLVDMSGGSSMKKYPYDGASDDAAAITAHVSGVFEGKVKATLKSEEPSPADTAGDVVVLKGKSFNELVMDNEKDVLVEFYAPWCGHCKKLAPVYDELGAMYKDNENIVIAKMDSTANEIDVPGVDVKGFPTLYFFPGKDKKAVKYEGGREVEDFVDYLKKNAHNDAKHTEL